MLRLPATKMKLSVILIFAAVIALTSGNPARRSAGVKYTILLDAGSTSSKLKVYSWSPPAASGNLPVVTLKSSTKFKPGLSDFEANLDNVTPYMTDIVNKAKTVVPDDQQTDTLFIVMATAGLRFYSANTSKSIMNKVKEFLSDQSLSPFRYSQGDVQILSGEEEAVYAWLALNYLAGYFQAQFVEPLGILELGGGSTQISFLPHEPLYAGEFHVTLNSKLYQLYAQSYLDLGADGIHRQVASQLLTEAMSAENTTINNPCLLEGDTKNIEMEDGRTLVAVGTGQPDQCLKVLRNILKPATGIACQPKPCAIGTVYQPSIQNVKFYAISAFRYAPEALDAIRADNSLDLEKLLNSARTGLCKKHISQVTNNEGGKGFASQNCMNGLYIPSLLHNAYGFEMDTTDIIIGKDIAGQSIDWALGAALMEISRSLGSNPIFVQKK